MNSEIGTEIKGPVPENPKLKTEEDSPMEQGRIAVVLPKAASGTVAPKPR